MPTFLFKRKRALVLLDLSRQIASMASPFPFDFDLLRSFVAVAENRGFTRAAARVGRTQSTVSLQIKKLEENLGRPLFERGSREQAGRLLADEFVEFGGDGSVSTRAEVLAWMETEAPSKRALSDFRAQRLAVEIVLVTYRSTRSGTVDESARHSLRSSIWKRFGPDWRMVFHQGTLTAPEQEHA